MKNIKIAICDDEENVVDIIYSTVSSAFAKHSVTADIETFGNAASLERRMRLQVFDLLFLDIDMPGMSGIELGERLRKADDKTDIVYVSGREDKVFDALKVHPFAFVRKANFLGDITETVRNYINTLSARAASTITVQGKGGIVNVAVSDVLYFEGSGKFQLMHITGKKEALPVYRAMEKLEEELSRYGFIRVHKGMLVNYLFISRISGSGYTLELTNGETLPVSRRKITDIKDRYLELLKGKGSVLL